MFEIHTKIIFSNLRLIAVEFWWKSAVQLHCIQEIIHEVLPFIASLHPAIFFNIVY